MDHGLVVKVKVKSEENVKSRFESLLLPSKKIKLTGGVGVTSEARKFLSNIKIAEKNLKDLTKNEIS